MGKAAALGTNRACTLVSEKVLTVLMVIVVALCAFYNVRLVPFGFCGGEHLKNVRFFSVFLQDRKTFAPLWVQSTSAFEYCLGS